MRMQEGQLLKLNKGGLDGPMTCHRCEGTMIHEKFYGHQENFWGWRCIFCGDIVDRIVLENRNSVAVGAHPRRGSPSGAPTTKVLGQFIERNKIMV